MKKQPHVRSIPRSSNARLFVAKIRMLGESVQETLSTFDLEPELAVIMRQFPSYEWDMILEKVMQNHTLRLAVASQVALEVAGDEVADFIRSASHE